MPSQVIIADSEIAKSAQALVRTAQTLRNQAKRLGQCFVELNTKGAIVSKDTLAAFERRQQELDGIAEKIEEKLSNLTANTLGFVSEMDEIDNFLY